MQEVAEIARVLTENRAVEFVFRQELFLDGCGDFSLAVKRPARREADQKEGDADHAEKHNRHRGKAAEHGADRMKDEG